jgi:hypothetical protein
LLFEATCLDYVTARSRNWNSFHFICSKPDRSALGRNYDTPCIVMSNVRPQVRSAIQNFIESQDSHHIASDVLRVIQEESLLMKETQDVKDMLDSDPMEQFGEIRPQVERLKKLLRVTSCSRVRTGSDYCGIHAVVTLEQCNNLQLTFRYERKPRLEGAEGCHVFFSIELSHNHGPRENLLVVQVWAPKNVPSIEPAVCVQEALQAAEGEDDEDGWEDIPSGEHGTPPAIVSDDSRLQSNKKQKISTSPPGEQSGNETDDEEVEETKDSYVAFLEPDLLQSLLESAGLLPMGEATAFFLLMTFPFYEQEWDIVGYVLDQIFGSDSDDEDET